MSQETQRRWSFFRRINDHHYTETVVIWTPAGWYVFRVVNAESTATHSDHINDPEHVIPPDTFRGNSEK